MTLVEVGKRYQYNVLGIIEEYVRMYLCSNRSVIHDSLKKKKKKSFCIRKSLYFFAPRMTIDRVFSLLSLYCRQ